MNILDQVPYSKGTILLGYRGSIAHGMYVPSSDPNSIDDKDFMGIVVPSFEDYFTLDPKKSKWNKGTRERFQGEIDLVEYEIKKMFSLLIKSNPNVMSLLWIKPEHRLIITEEGKELIDNRHLFISKNAFYAFMGYATSQLSKMGKIAGRGFRGEKRSELVEKYGFDTKNGAHCIRLLRMGIEYLKTGEMNVDRTSIDASELLDIKKGKWTSDRVIKEATDLFEQAKDAYEHSTLPEEPDITGIDNLLQNIVAKQFFMRDLDYV